MILCVIITMDRICGLHLRIRSDCPVVAPPAATDVIGFQQFCGVCWLFGAGVFRGKAFNSFQIRQWR